MEMDWWLVELVLFEFWTICIRNRTIYAAEGQEIKYRTLVYFIQDWIISGLAADTLGYHIVNIDIIWASSSG